MMDWNPRFLESLPLFEPLRVQGTRLVTPNWPSIAELQAAFDGRGVLSGGGKPLHVLAQGATRARTLNERYEVRLFERGELLVREHEWHDVFNALVWLAFPRSKAAINARHYQALSADPQAAIQRGPTQDTLTLFDEGGVIVVSSEPDLFDALRGFEWKRLFWRERERVLRHMRWMLFGHAIYEKALAPFVGITGRAVLLDVDATYHALPLAEQMQLADLRMAELIADPTLFNSTRDLAPAPILGVPGWWPANRVEVFYDNSAYFRPGRRAAADNQEARNAVRGDARR